MDRLRHTNVNMTIFNVKNQPKIMHFDFIMISQTNSWLAPKSKCSMEGRRNSNIVFEVIISRKIENWGVKKFSKKNVDKI